MKFDNLARQYRGEVAQEYENDRRSPKWHKEQEIVSVLLASIGAADTVLDIPVGTGRFIPIYCELGIPAVGMDISEDMLAQAASKVRQATDAVSLQLSDIRAIDAVDGQFDCVVCMRFLNWIDSAQLNVILKELARVSKKHIIVSVRHFVRVRELGSFIEISTITRTLRQVKRKLYGLNGLTFHKHRSVNLAFDAAQLHVKKAELVESRSDGTDYYIYLLEKVT